MLESYKRLFLISKNPERSSYIWNAVTGILFAMQSPVILVVIMRTNSLVDAGVFSIAYAIVSMMSFIGEFGVRKYQVSDVNEINRFSDYYAYRILSCSAMFTACIIYDLYGYIFIGYSHQKFLVIISLTFVKLVEAFVDVFHGRMQQRSRLDVAAKSDSFRIIIGILCCSISLLITRNLLFSCAVWALSVAVAACMSTMLVAPEFCDLKPRFEKGSFRRIFKECMPLFLGSFILLYLSNAPKYAIDTHMDDSSQAYYNFIFMPVFIIGLLANFIYNPILVTMSEKWDSGEYKKFNGIILQQSCFIGGLTALAVAVALTIGCPVLGIIYHTDLSDFRIHLTILMIGGGMLALVNYLTIVMTIIRQQRYLTGGYIAIAAAAFILSGRFVAGYGIMGATVLYTTLMTALAILFTVLLVIFKRKERNARC